MSRGIIDQALDYLGKRVLKEATATYTFERKSAGAHGYITVNMSGIPSTAKIVSTMVSTGSISGSAGMQLYVINASYSSVWINYYFPQATTQTVQITVKVVYY